MIVENTKSALKGIYESVDEYVEAAETFNGGNKKRHQHWLNYKADDWFGLDNNTDFAGVKSLITEGWMDGASKMGNKMDTLSMVPTRSIKRRNVWTDNGDSLDMQQVYNGNLDRAWRRPARVACYGPRKIRIVVESMENGCADSDRMFWRGAAAVLLADMLQEAGYSVELVSGFYGKSEGCDILSSVVTKSYQVPVDISSVAATTALPAFFRAIGHAWYQSHVKVDCGMDGMWVDSIMKKEDFFKGEEDLCLFATQDIGSLGNAQDWMKKCLETIEGDNEMVA